MRRLAGDDPAVNEEWNCDKGRWAFQYAAAKTRLTSPMTRDDEGYIVEASWTDALAKAAAGLKEWRGKVGVLTGGRLTVEDAYAYSKFARIALGTDDIDFRAREHSDEERQFLAGHVAGRYLETTYDDIQHAPTVLLAGLEPEEESPILLLRLRKAATKFGTQVFSVAPFGSATLAKVSGRLLASAPGTEAEVLAALAAADERLDELGSAAAEQLRKPGSVILVGERLAAVPGGLSAAVRLAEASGAKLAWVPRRAGDRGALEAGCLPGLLPGGRPLTDPVAREQLGAFWPGLLPTEPGRDTTAILQAAAQGELALVVAGVDPDDLPDPALALAALSNAPFVLSLEISESAVTDRADVVLPVAPAVEKQGSYLDWEGRVRPFDATLEATGAVADRRALHRLAEAMGVDLALPDASTARAEIAEVAAWAGERPAMTMVDGHEPPQPQQGQAVLASWHLLLDDGRLQAAEPFLAGTRRASVARLAAATAAEIGAGDGSQVTVRTPRGAITLPLVITDMPERVVWVPTYSAGSHVHADLGVGAGAVVDIGVAQ
jgi:NADH-quinone oxidoreductase subunit G